MSTEVRSVQADDLRDFCEAAFLKAGLTEAAAFTAADNLIAANLRGVDSHGVVRLPKYIKRLRARGAKARPEIKVTAKGPAFSRIDGDHGLGLVVGKFAMEEAISLAAKSGVGAVTVFNSDHFGMAAYFAMMALSKDMIGVALSNVTPVMTVWGGRGSFMGNNPIAIAVPCRKEWPVVYDVALSKVAGGKVRLAAEKGENIPGDWITDRNGIPTQDPKEFENGGALLPMGIKGYGLAVIVEVLAGVLAGARIMDEIPFWVHNLSERVALGHFMMALDIKSFIGLEDFKKRMDYLVTHIHQAPKAQNVDRIYLPGEIEFMTERQRREGGIPLPDVIYKELVKVAEDLELPILSTKVSK